MHDVVCCFKPQSKVSRITLSFARPLGIHILQGLVSSKDISLAQVPSTVASGFQGSG